jgi:hypothetical protein
VLGGPAENVAQRSLVVLGERGDRSGRFAHELVDVRAQLDAGRGECEHLDAPIPAGALPLDQSPTLEPVGDAGDIRGVADEELGEGAHRQRALGVEQPKGVGLREGQAELGERGSDPSSLHHPDLEEQLLGLMGNRHHPNNT